MTAVTFHYQSPTGRVHEIVAYVVRDDVSTVISAIMRVDRTNHERRIYRFHRWREEVLCEHVMHRLADYGTDSQVERDQHADADDAASDVVEPCRSYGDYLAKFFDKLAKH